MIKKEYLIMAFLLIIIAVLGLLIVNVTQTSQNTDAGGIYRQIIANDSSDPGTVEVIRNIGNTDGQRIAYVVGVHPLEYQTHYTLLNLLPNMSELKNSYDIYIINVTQDVGHYGDGASDDSPGRQNGQNLAYKYVYPQIVEDNYSLAVDVHSNVGAYEYQTFVFSPIKEGLGSEYASKVALNCENISDFAPSSTTSGPYLTIPLNEHGIPAFYFEEYSFASQDVKDMHMLELINAVDNLF